MADSESRAGSSYATGSILEWCARVHAPQDAALIRAFATPVDVPAIMLSPAEGKLLTLLCRLANIGKAVELGTLLGYSTIHIARSLRAGGHLWTIESEPRHAALAQQNLSAAGCADRVTVLIGPALDCLPQLVQHGPFDAVFIDADKVNYHHYGEWAIANLRPGGLLLGDNAYLFGELLDSSDRGHAMRQFHQLIARHCDSVCIPTPDGMVLGIKRQ